MKYEDPIITSTTTTIQNDLKELQQYTSFLGASIDVDEQVLQHQKQIIQNLSANIDLLTRRIQLFEDDYAEHLKQEVRYKMHHNQKLTQRDRIVKQWL